MWHVKTAINISTETTQSFFWPYIDLQGHREEVSKGKPPVKFALQQEPNTLFSLDAVSS